ncbi:MAG: hypothetical protein ACE5JU_17845 [Candidatus Binatia bacterium]
MMRTEPIEELAKLLTEEKRLEEKVHETKATLSSVKKKISESLVRPYINRTEGTPPMEEDLMKTEQAFERLLQALLEMKQEIQTRIRPLEEQIVKANAEYLKDTFDQQKNMLGDCLNAIDQKILDCRQHIEEYERIHSDLNTINERLSRLGGEPLPTPNSLHSTDIGDIIRQRIEHLRSQGKI